MTKNQTLKISIIFCILFLCNTYKGIAQNNQDHLYFINTQYMVTGLDSNARAERNAVMKEYFEKVEMKNELIIHQWNMTHFFSEDSREFITMYEFANWADIEKSGDRGTELEKLAWPDPVKRKDFLKKMSSYFTHHKDAIYHGMPNMVK